MFLLPKGNPLYENVAAAKVKLPEILDKLKNGGFTGYLNFLFPSANVTLFFEGGKLISTMCEQGSKNTSGFEALTELCSQIVAGDGSLSVYRLSRDLVMGLHALLHGEVLYKAQELKLINVKGLLEKMKARKLNGCLRIYTEDRSALIFYKEGSPLGFFHDGASEIETSATESQKIAGLPGAKVDILSTKSADELMHMDLLEMVNIDKIWETTRARHEAQVQQQYKEAQERDKRHQDAKLLELEDDLKEVAAAYLGKMGRALIEKELADCGGRIALLDHDRITKFLAGVERSSKLLTSISKLKEMTELLQKEIGRLSM
ncbi:GTPase-activating protein [Geotalea sp. SG265]|uniref:GTPase-activating protein n=1 Tax=Geotalea sp. SG265 TaxID=2922867 RepID=UPI001FAFFBE2|nr:GTPase-activating protein [Geotalea sp. SG265]